MITLSNWGDVRLADFCGEKKRGDGVFGEIVVSIITSVLTLRSCQKYVIGTLNMWITLDCDRYIKYVEYRTCKGINKLEMDGRSSYWRRR